MGPDAMILVFWMLSFKPTFSLSSFTFIKRFFSSSSLSTMRVVSSAYLRLLIFLPAIFIPACASSSPAFLMMYSAHKLNKQGDNIQPWCTPFPIWNQSVVPCPALTVVSWPAFGLVHSKHHIEEGNGNPLQYSCLENPMTREPNGWSRLASACSRLSFFFFFYWSIVDLQCCVCFRCTTKWLTFIYI